MKLSLLFGIIALSAVPALAGATSAEGVTWMDDFDKAQAAAREAKKDLFVDFTGSDWCGWCHKLDDEVFSHDEFLDAISQDYVLVKLDLPKGAPALAAVPDIDRNRALVREYGVKGFPSVLLMTAEGEVYGRDGYLKGGPKNYVRRISELRAQGRPPLVAANKLVRDFEAADEAAKARLVDASISQLKGAKAGSPVARKLAPIAGHALELDPKNEGGLLVRALQALLPSGMATDTQMARGRELDPKNEAFVLELVVLAELLRVTNEAEVRALLESVDALDAVGPINDKEAARMIYINAAQWQKTFKRDSEACRKYARKARPLVQDDPAMLKKVDELLRG